MEKQLDTLIGETKEAYTEWQSHAWVAEKHPILDALDLERWDDKPKTKKSTKMTSGFLDVRSLKLPNGKNIPERTKLVLYAGDDIVWKGNY